MNHVHSRQCLVCILYILLLPLFFNSAAAQSGGDQFRHFNARDGQSNTFVWEMLQDRYGFIWSVGNAGLEKFDGQTFTTYRNNPQNPQSVPGGEMRALIEAKDGMLWVGSSQGLGIFNPARESSKTVVVADSIRRVRFVWALHQDDKGDIWAGTAEGLHRFPVQDFSADTLATQFFLFNEEEIAAKTIRSITPRDDHSLWVATNSGLHIFDRESHEFTRTGPFEDDIERVLAAPNWQVFTDQNEHLWVSTELGLVYWADETLTPELITTFPNSDLDLSNTLVQSLYQHDDGMLYVGTSEHGAFILNPETMEVSRFLYSEGNTNSLSENDVHYFFRDLDGNYWFGYHYFGISMMHRELWNYTFAPVIPSAPAMEPDNQIRSLMEDSRGNLWFGTSSGSVVMKSSTDSETRIFAPNLKPATTNPREDWVQILHDSGEKIYFTTLRQLFVLDVSSGSIEEINLPDSEATLINTRGDDQYLYVGTVASGLLLIDKTDHSVTVITIPDYQSESDELPVMDTYIDVGGNIWIAVFESFATPITWDVYSFDPETFQFHPTDHPIVPDLNFVTVPAPSTTEPGVFWLATNEGLLRQNFITGENRLFLPDELVVSNAIFYQVLPDRDGYVWIGGMSGLLRFDPVTETLSFFDPDASRRPMIFLLGTQAANGDIVFGGVGGYIRFNPNELLEEAPIQFVHLTGMRAGSETIPLLYEKRDSYRIDHNSNNLSFTFTGLNYKSPASTRYRYRLTGYQDDWEEIGMQNQVFLANLNPGSYVFQVQARNRNGSYGDSVAEVAFTILPPWWRTVPAYLFFTLLLIGGIFGVDRFQRNRLLAKSKEQAREKELKHAREIEIAYRDLESAHENLKAAQNQLVQQEKLASLGQLTAGIAHEIKNPLNFVNNFSDVSLEMIDEVRDEIKSVEAIHELPLQNISEILDDIEANLRKIHEHGSRADGIVKSMLLHSRGGSGEMAPAPLNPFIKEYVNLAFHGMRAGKDPISVDIELDLDENVGEVPLIAEDFSRVILNLCNNAFDAMRDKTNMKSPSEDTVGAIHELPLPYQDYQPKLTVRTQSKNGAITIEIEDNGPGIPDEIKDKILQPFFTTKKGTQGTGLGLSITNDIVKAHGGSLNIESDTEKGTTFMIELPHV